MILPLLLVTAALAVACLSSLTTADVAIGDEQYARVPVPRRHPSRRLDDDNSEQAPVTSKRTPAAITQLTSQILQVVVLQATPGPGTPAPRHPTAAPSEIMVEEAIISPVGEAIIW